MIHDLKVHPQFWRSVVCGAMPFQLRRNDRKFRVGDTIILREFDPEFGYTNRHGELKLVVTFVLAHEDFPNGIAKGYVVLGFGRQAFLDDGK
jgi:hypothetical protein